MAELNSRMSLPFTGFAAILRTVLCLSLILALAQVVDPDPDLDPDLNSGGNSNSDSTSGSDSGSGKKPPVVDIETKVPGTISDLACDTGRRIVVKVYKNGVLMKTERGDCV